MPVQEGPAKGEQERWNCQGSAIVNYFPCIRVENSAGKSSGLLEKESKAQKGKGLMDRTPIFFDKQRNSNCQADCCQCKGFHTFFTIYDFQTIMISANKLQVKVSRCIVRITVPTANKTTHQKPDFHIQTRESSYVNSQEFRSVMRYHYFWHGWCLQLRVQSGALSRYETRIRQLKIEYCEALRRTRRGLQAYR